MGMADGPMTIPHLVTTKVTISREAGILHMEAQEALGMVVAVRAILLAEALIATMGITVQATRTAEGRFEAMGDMDRGALQAEAPIKATVQAGRSILQAILRAAQIPPVRELGGCETTEAARERRTMRSKSVLCRSRHRSTEHGSEQCFRQSS